MACTLRPDNPDYMFQLARGYEKTNRLADALPIAMKADQLKPGNAELQSLLGYIKMRMEKKQDTLSGGPQ
jgi:cytochrome c-type biogenesis protein CcmH/NrfG